MPRILADLPDEDIAWLDRRAEQDGRSRAAVLREAVASFKMRSPNGDMGWLDAAFGAWTSACDVHDPVAWQRRERASWTRPWDDAFEEIRAEFPELFDDEDDRQRLIHLHLIGGRSADPEEPGT